MVYYRLESCLLIGVRCLGGLCIVIYGSKVKAWNPASLELEAKNLELEAGSWELRDRS